MEESREIIVCGFEFLVDVRRFLTPGKNAVSGVLVFVFLHDLTAGYEWQRLTRAVFNSFALRRFSAVEFRTN